MILQSKNEYASFRGCVLQAIKSVTIGLLAFSSVWSSAQGLAGVASEAQEKATRVFAVQCAGCHGFDAHGTDKGPARAGDPALRARSVASLRSLIHNGIPASGMPAFNLPDDELNALAIGRRLIKLFFLSPPLPAAEPAVKPLVVSRRLKKSYACGRGEPNRPTLSEAP